MSDALCPPPAVLAVSASLSPRSQTRAVVKLIAARLQEAGCAVDVLDMAEESLPLFNPDSSHAAPGFGALRARVERADVLLLGTPDYHGGMSGALKNFLDHFWKEFAGRLLAPVVASQEKGLTVSDHIRTVARQCYAWAMPYAMAFADGSDVKEGQVISETFAARIQMFVRDVRVYGGLLARQRRLDLEGAEPGFLARYRASKPV
ncbi:MAG TPA: NAD(P)H-dependent oxidoreductase [Methylomirabilota bacterium]|nr:NAD(P)H-dependent oxidoreductase [Methylomirabilota bacterium]